jgi:hypothetical protein
MFLSVEEREMMFEDWFLETVVPSAPNDRSPIDPNTIPTSTIFFFFFWGFVTNKMEVLQQPVHRPLSKEREVELFSKYLEILIHSLLNERSFYPAESFQAHMGN